MKILLIMPGFFDYPQMISNELKEMGHEVDCFDDRPSTNPFIKAIIRVNKGLIKKYIRKYFDGIMKVITAKKYDVFLLISGQSLSFEEEMIGQIRKSQTQARFVLYQWDSQKNFPYIQKVQKFFDKCYSFDRNDVENNKNLTFLPLFFSSRYQKIGEQKKTDYKYDFSFVGTAHPQKYKFISEMSGQLKKIYPRQFIYFFYPSRIVFLYRKLFNKELKRARYSEFHYVPLDGKAMDELIMDTKCILDSPQAGQTGLTIRVFEALGAKRKLITTNPDIVNYDFYKEENIYVYDGEFDYGSPFFEKSYVELPGEIYHKYSLRNWLDTLLNKGDIR